MYFKIRSKIMYRDYVKYGYLTDDSLFGYYFLNDEWEMPGEKYVSESAAVMLNMLSKEPQHIDVIVEKLENIFEGVGHEELKEDTMEFFCYLVEEGFLCMGETPEQCDKNDISKKKAIANNNVGHAVITKDTCGKEIFQDTSLLRSLHIEIANECNERCVHCYIPHEFKLKVMEASLFYKIIEEARDLNVINITISGGEPLLHKELIPFLKKCRALDFSVNLLTNLTLLSDDIILELEKNPLLSVQTSLYSMDPSVHDSITMVNGSFEKTKKNLMRLLDKRIPVQISCPVMKQNKDSFVEVVKWGNANNMAVSVDYVIFASYDHSNTNLENRLSLQEVEEAFEKRLNKEYAKELVDIAKEKLMVKPMDSICTVCRYYFCVSAEGNAFPCVGWQSKKIGDLNEESVQDIWSSANCRELRKITLEQFPKCVDCKDRGFCTICMMSNSNESPQGNVFDIKEFHCNVSSMKHDKVMHFLK